jgi:hypothetical protein
MPRRRNVWIEDDGTFKRFMQNAPKVFRAVVRQAIKDTAEGPVEMKMRAYARVGPDAPHIKDDIEVKVAQKSAQVGYLKAEPAGGSDPNATQPDVALYQNYGTKRAKGNAFMSRAADDSANEYRDRMIKALREAERKLAI